MDGDALAALHRIGYTQAVPEVPESLSADAKDFLARCRQASDWCTAAQLLEHPFLASAGVGVYAKPQAAESKWVSPKSTLDAALWETESDTEEAEHEHSRHSGSSVGHSRHHPLQNLASYELLSSCNKMLFSSRISNTVEFLHAQPLRLN